MNDPLKELLLKRVADKAVSIAKAHADVRVFSNEVDRIFRELRDFVDGSGAAVSENPRTNLVTFFGQAIVSEFVFHIRLNSGFFDLSARTQFGADPRAVVHTLHVNAPRYAAPFNISQQITFQSDTKTFHLVVGALIDSRGPVYNGPEITIQHLKQAVIEAIS